MAPKSLALSDVVAPARHRNSVLVDAARTWALTNLCWLPADLVALVIAAAEPVGDRPLPDTFVVGTYWTRAMVNELVMHGADQWCRQRHTMVPLQLAESLWRFLDFLDVTRQLHPDSDPLQELRRPLRCFAELGPTGIWQPDVAFDPGPCVCFEPYTGPTHGELTQARGGPAHASRPASGATR